MVNSLVTRWWRQSLVLAAMGLGFLIAAKLPAAPSGGSDEADSIDRDYSGDLPRLPPVEPTDALASFDVEPGFRLELAAAEPQVTDPVALDFDEQGRLFVVEMLGYSENPDDMLGRIRMLEDVDGDGRFEKSTIYAEGLAWPTALLCYDGGIFVGAPPEILYFKDIDGDGRAEERKVAFTGFNTNNVQGLLNSFRWGLDNRIHVAVSSCGADLRRGYQPDAEPLVLRGRNFSFDPRTLQFTATSGASQHGLSIDPWGRQFTCNNSNHIQQILLEDRLLSRNPYLRSPAVLGSIAVEGPAADVFRISPVEPWREIRTRLRMKGIVPGIVEGGGRAAGYFTSATGVTIFTGDAWPEEYRGNAFIGDVGSNLVHRKTIGADPKSIARVARRATPDREFIASHDTWFRPVQFANGPDGNLYVLDMYREVIEHPDSLPPIIKKHLDLTSGRDRGRIYRVTRDDAAQAADAAGGDAKGTASRKLPAGATTAELVALLAHANGWHRTTAARLLYEQNDPTAVPLLQKLLRSAAAEGRVLALYALANRQALDADGLLLALGDDDAQLREQAARLAGVTLADADALSAADRQRFAQGLVGLADDPELLVRFQTAFALGETSDRARIAALVEIIRRDAANEYVQIAVLSSLARDSERLFHELLTDEAFRDSPGGRLFLVELAREIGARGEERELDSLAADLVAAQQSAASLADELLVSVLRGAGPQAAAVRRQLEKQATGAVETIIAKLVAASLALAADESAEPAQRAAAVAGLALDDYAAVASPLGELLAPQQPQEVQLAALSALGQFSDADVAAPIIDAWAGMSPALRIPAAELLVSRARYAKALLAAIESQRLTPRDLDPSTIQRLANHADLGVRERAMKVLEAAGPKRTEVVEAHRDVLDLTGDAARGREVFRKNCAICHRREGYGTEVGADLATVVTRTPEGLLINILDPNREVDPKFIQYNLVTVDGLAVSGMIAAETAASVTLTGAEKATTTVPRAEIDQLQSTGVTLMPEGFEKVIDRQGLADLIAYLGSQ